MSDEKKSKRYVYAPLEEEDHAALLSFATEEGVKPERILERAVQELIENWPSFRETDEHKIRALVLRDRKRQNTWAMLKTLAYAYRETGDEQEFETLEDACAIAKVPVDTVLDAIEKTEHISSVAVSSSNTTRTAVMFLGELMQPDQMYSVTDLEEMARARGLSWHTVKAAKRKMQIESVRVGMAWYWKAPPQESGM